MKRWQPCLKKTVVCTIVAEDGTEFTGVNVCNVSNECARASMASGEGYELCGPPLHAEEAALNKALTAGYDDLTGAVAYLDGHTYFCMECQHALQAQGCRTYVVTG